MEMFGRAVHVFPVVCQPPPPPPTRETFFVCTRAGQFIVIDVRTHECIDTVYQYIQTPPRCVYLSSDLRTQRSNDVSDRCAIAIAIYGDLCTSLAGESNEPDHRRRSNDKKPAEHGAGKKELTSSWHEKVQSIR